MLWLFNTFTKDHWSCLLFLEARIVDHDGSVQGGRSCPHMNDADWLAVDEFIEAKMLTWKGTGMNPRFELTDLGWAVAHAVRRTRAGKGSPEDYAREANLAAQLQMISEEALAKHLASLEPDGPEFSGRHPPTSIVSKA